MWRKAERPNPFACLLNVGSDGVEVFWGTGGATANALSGSVRGDDDSRGEGTDSVVPKNVTGLAVTDGAGNVVFYQHKVLVCEFLEIGGVDDVFVQCLASWTPGSASEEDVHGQARGLRLC